MAAEKSLREYLLKFSYSGWLGMLKFGKGWLWMLKCGYVWLGMPKYG